jgi:hypothetical protein
MKETAAAVDAFVLCGLSTICRHSVPVEPILHLPRIRAQPYRDQARLKLRATFMRLIFQMLSDKDWRTRATFSAVNFVDFAFDIPEAAHHADEPTRRVATMPAKRRCFSASSRCSPPKQAPFSNAKGARRAM